MRQIDLNIQGSRVSVGPGDPCVAGEGNASCIHLAFDPDWDGLTKTAVFWDAMGQNPVRRLLTDGLLDPEGDGRSYRLPIPAEPLAAAGTFTLVLDGAGEGVRMRTLPVELEVAHAPDWADAALPADPTPTQAEQLQQEMQALSRHVEQALPVRGVDYWTAEDVAQVVAETKAQMAAGERYECIDTVVTTEPVNEIRRTQEPDGTAYRFKRILANIYCPKADAAASMYIWNGSGSQIGYVGNAVNTSERYCRVTVDTSGGYLESQCTTPTGKNSYQSVNVTAASVFRAMQVLDGIRFTAGTTFPAGTKIDIYGVRA